MDTWHNRDRTQHPDVGHRGTDNLWCQHRVLTLKHTGECDWIRDRSRQPRFGGLDRTVDPLGYLQ